MRSKNDFTISLLLALLVLIAGCARQPILEKNDTPATPKHQRVESNKVDYIQRKEAVLAPDVPKKFGRKPAFESKLYEERPHSLDRQIKNLEQKRDLLLVKYTEHHPDVVTVQIRINRLQSRRMADLAEQVQTLRVRPQLETDMKDDVQSRDPDCDRFVNLTGDPVSGGAGYRDVLNVADADYVVFDAPGLLAALKEAISGDVVYVKDCAKIDLTGERSIPIAGGVTLASGRGNEDSACPEGGLVFTDEYFVAPLDHKGRSIPSVVVMFEGQGNDIRITGIRLRGPDTGIGSSKYGYSLGRGMQVNGHDGLEVDNCELWGWPHAAIYAREAGDVYVHHNHIHHNRRAGLGYGTVLMRRATAVFEANLYRYNRHSIAGSGERDQSYEARYNVSLPGSNGHEFDMHGEKENPKDPSVMNSPYAGGVINIHHNIFFDIKYPGVVIRGEPYFSGDSRNNWFAHARISDAVHQRFYVGAHPKGHLGQPSRPFVGIYTGNNCFGFKGCFRGVGNACDQKKVGAGRIDG